MLLNFNLMMTGCLNKAKKVCLWKNVRLQLTYAENRKKHSHKRFTINKNFRAAFG